MMKKLKISVCFLAMIFAFGSLSWAEEQKVETKEKEIKEVELETIVVTTTRESVDKALELRREHFMGTAYTMDIETIEESGAIYMGEVMRRVPGIVVREDINRLRGFIGSRGLSQAENLITYEGIPATAMAYGWSTLNLAIQPERIGGIEILRGPAALEYGTGTVGGVINMFDYPLVKKRELRASQVIGSNAELTSSLRGGVTLGEDIGTRVYVIHKQGDGTRERMALRQDDLTVSIGSIKEHGTTWRFTANVSDNRSETPSYLSREQYEKDPTLSPAKHDEISIQHGHLDFTLDHPVSDRLNVGIKSYVNSFERNWWFQKGEKNSNVSRVVVMGGIEPRMRIKIGDNNRFKSGVRLHIEEKEQPKYEGDSPTARHGKIVKFERSDAVSIAWYGIDEHDFTDRLSGLFGLRIDHFGQSHIVSQTSKSSKAHNETTEVVPSVGLRYRLTPYSQVFANVSRSYNPPKYGQLLEGAEHPEPQQGTTYELGTRSLLGNIFSVDTTLFYNDYDNLITSEKDPITDETIYTNQGHTMQRGLEFAGTLFGGGLSSSLEGLTLYTAITLLDTEIKAGENKGNELPFAPHLTAYTSLRYEHGMGPGIAWGMIDCLYVGDYFSDDANTKVETANAAKGEIPAYSVWNFNAGYRFRKGLSLQVGVRNLFDRKYFNSRGYAGGIVPGPALTSYAKVSYEFF